MNNNTRKEKIGIQYLEKLCLESAYLEPNISVNDKTPSFDGQIILYKKEMPINSKGYLKEYLERIIPIQVKTTEIDSTLIPSLSYMVDIIDLRNFYNNNGVLFFIVGIEKEKNENIVLFYNDLTPVKLETLLKNTQKEKGKIKLDFVKMNINIENLIRNFCISLKKQGLFDYVHNKLRTFNSMSDLNREFKYIEMKFNFLGEDIFNAEVYGYDKKMDILIPFDFDLSVELVKNTQIGCIYKIKVEDTVFYNIESKRLLTDIALRKCENFYLKLSDNLSIRGGIKEGLEFKMTFIGNMYSIFYDLKFLCAALLKGYIYIEDIKIVLKINENILDVLKDCISYFSFFIAILKLKYRNDLKIKFLNIENEKKEIIDKLYFEQVMQKKDILKDNSFSIIQVTVNNENLGYIVMYDSVNGTLYYTFYDFLNLNCYIKIEKMSNKHLMLFYAINFFESIKEPFLRLKEEEIIFLIQKFESIELIKTNELEYYNLPLLKLLNYYDAENNKEIKDKIIIFIEKIYSILINKVDKENYIYMRLNCLQTIKRNRTLSDLEIRELKDMCINNKEINNITKMGIYILLEDWRAFKEIFNEIDKENKKIIITWPILNLVPSELKQI